MPKSKAQKQAEAIERKRKNFPSVIAHWCRSQVGGEYYNRLLSSSGKKWADQNMVDAERLLVVSAVEAHLDRYGNPL